MIVSVILEIFELLANLLKPLTMLLGVWLDDMAISTNKMLKIQVNGFQKTASDVKNHSRFTAYYLNHDFLCQRHGTKCVVL